MLVTWTKPVIRYLFSMFAVHVSGQHNFRTACLSPDHDFAWRVWLGDETVGELASKSQPGGPTIDAGLWVKRS